MKGTVMMKERNWQRIEKIRTTCYLLLAMMGVMVLGSSAYALSGPSSAELFEYAEWHVDNPSWSGNAFDVEADVQFTHAGSGQTVDVDMFYDGNDDWKFRFTGTETGTWNWSTSSSDPELNGHSGSINITPNSDAYGFVTHDGNKWARQKGDADTLETFVPHFRMGFEKPNFNWSSSEINYYMGEWMEDEGFNGVLVFMAGYWVNRDGNSEFEARDPDPRSFDVLEEMIDKARDRGGVVHIWYCGDKSRGQSPTSAWGAPGASTTGERRLLEYIGDRLGPVPGWVMGYGYDNPEHVNTSQLQSWGNYLRDNMAYDHLLGARDQGTNITYTFWPEADFYSRGHWFNGAPYSDLAAAIDTNTSKPHSFDERWWRSRLGSEANIRRQIWDCNMAGGVSSIIGNTGDWERDPFNNQNHFETFFTFWDGRFPNNFQRDNGITNKGHALATPSRDRAVVYAEGTSSITVSGMPAGLEIVAVNAKSGYSEINKGTTTSGSNVITLGSNSDWALAIGDFGAGPTPPDTTPPSQVNGLSATAAGYSRIDLSWNAASDPESGVASYNVYRDGGSTPVANVAGTSYSDTGLSGSTTYSYEVSAVNGAGLEGSKSSSVSETTDPAPPPGTRIGINLVNVNTDNEANYGGVVMDSSDTAGVVSQTNWNNLDEDATNSLVENDGSGGYQPTPSQQFVDDNGTPTTLSVVWNTGNAVDGNTTGTSNGDQKMMSGTSQAGGGSNDTGSLALSNVPYATYDVIVYMAEPQGHGGSNIVTVTDGSTTYYIDHGGIPEIHTQSTATSAGAVSGEATYVRFTGLSGDTTITHDNNGSAWKSGLAGLQIVSAGGPVDPPAAPTALAASAVSSSQIDLTWTDNATDEDGFKIERKTGAGSWSQIDTVGTDVTAYSDTGLTASTTYDYRVLAYNSGGDSAYSNTDSATTPADPVDPPAAPTALAASTVSSSRIDLSWTDNATDEDGFKIERKTGAGSWSQIDTVGTDVTAYSDTGLAASTTYDYRVRAYNGGGDSAYSNTDSATTNDPPPVGDSIGINLVNVNTNTEANYGGVVMDPSDTAGVVSQTNWNNLDEDTTNSLVENDGSGGYQPTASQQFVDSDGNPTTLSVVWNTGNAVDGNSTGTSNGDQKMMSGTSQAGGGADDTGSLALSNVPYATYDVIVYMAEPQGHGGSNIVTVTDGSTTYYIDHGGIPEIHTQSTATSAGAVSGEATYVRFNGLSGSTTITHDNNGSAWKSGLAGLQIVSAGGPVDPPAAPTALAASAVSSSQIDLTWTDNATDEDGFKIERKTGAGSWSQIDTVGTDVTAYSDTGLTASTTYDYRVLAYNSGGDSAYSNTDSATTPADPVDPPAAPSGLAASAVSSSRIDLSWTDNASDEDGFKIERKTGSGGTWSQIDTTAADATVYSDTGLSATTTYFYRVRAYNADGDSAYSNEASATTDDEDPPSDASIGINLVNVNTNTEANYGGVVMDPSDTAGVVSQTNWNNLDEDTTNSLVENDGSGGYQPTASQQFVDSDGNPTTLSVVWNTGNAVDGNSTGASNGDQKMMSGVSQAGGGSDDTGSLALSNVPYATYDVIVYMAEPQGHGGSNIVTVTDGSTTWYIDHGGIPEIHTQSTATSAGTVTGEATYVRFTGLSGDTTITHDNNGAAWKSGLAGLQIVSAGGPVDPPAAPTALAASAVSSSQIDLTWTDNATDEDGFKIERKTGAGSWSQIDTVGTDVTAYSDTGLTASTTYDYRVLAYNSGGDSAYSNTDSATTPADPVDPPAAPTALAASTVSSSRIDLSWTDNATDEDGFQIERKTGSGGTWSQIDTTAADATVYSDTGLSATTTYFYRVRAFNTGGDSAYSNEDSATTDDEDPPSDASIGINLVNVNTNNEANYGGVVMDASDTAGVAVQSNWNNLDEDSTNSLVENDGSGGYQPTASQQFVDSDGNPTTLSVVWNTGNAVDGNSTGTSNGDQKMMSGVSQAGGGSDDTGSLALSNVPYATYDVIVYMAEPKNHGGSNIVTVTDGSTTYYIDHGGIPEIHTQSTATSAGTVTGEATYVRFTGLSGDTTITHDNNGSAWKSGLAGLQIVADGDGTTSSSWENQDIGNVGAAGSVSETDGTFTIEGSGADIWSGSDAFHFMYQQMSGDCEITARVESVENTDSLAKAGVMIRETLNADSVHAMTAVTPGNGVSFQRRISTGGTSAGTTDSGITAPHWVKIVRSGDSFSAYRSTDGSNWTQIGSTISITMSSTVYVGLPVTSHNNGTLCTAVFDNVTLQ